MIHYTKNLCQAFIKNDKVKDFHLVITESESQQSKYLVIDSRTNKQAALNAINKADLMIGTFYVNDLMKERIESGKLTFIASERIFKPYSKNFLVNALKNLARYIKFKIILTKNHFHNNNVYFLLIGHYAPSDYMKLGVRKEHILKFGYFPASNVTKRKNYCVDEVIHLLWVGRFLSWKNPRYAIETCKYLTQKGYSVDLKIIGSSPEESNLKQEAQGYENIYFLGSLPNEQVRKIMSESDIFLFTSNEAEGCGVVLSEAMSEGMCVIASETAGASLELIQDGKNGKIYSLNSLTELKFITEQILNHKEEIPRLGQAAQDTILNEWNADKTSVVLIKEYQELERKYKT